MLGWASWAATHVRWPAVHMACPASTGATDGARICQRPAAAVELVLGGVQLVQQRDSNLAVLAGAY